MSTVLKLKGDNGEVVSVEVPDNLMTSEQKQISQKLFGSDNDVSISEEEWGKIKDLRAHVRGNYDNTALIVRFDVTWVRIDEAALPFPGRVGR